MNKPSILLGSIAALLFLGIGFFMSRSNNVARQEDKLQISASFYPLYFFAKEVGGDKANVITIVPAGAQPHDYEPRPQDIVRIQGSAILFLNGAGLEAWADNIKTNLADKKTRVLAVGQELATRQIEEEGETIIDPHVWLSPLLAQQMLDIMVKAYTDANPQNTSYYQAQGTALKSRLQQLDNEYRQGLRSCARKDFVTSHAAFGYLAQEYSLNQISIAGLSPDAQPSAQQLVQIVQFARQHHITHIFFESLVSPKLAQTIASEVGAQTLVLDPIEGLSDEDMTQGKDYFSQMRQNLKNLQIALQCQT